VFIVTRLTGLSRIKDPSICIKEICSNCNCVSPLSKHYIDKCEINIAYNHVFEKQF